MDFVTITDRHTIAGVQELNDRAEVFLEELTASFRGEPHAVHVLCLGSRADRSCGCARMTCRTRRSSTA
jgi:hypothetical protein